MSAFPRYENLSIMLSRYIIRLQSYGFLIELPGNLKKGCQVCFCILRGDNQLVVGINRAFVGEVLIPLFILVSDNHFLQLPLYNQIADNDGKWFTGIIVYRNFYLLIAKVNSVEDAHEFLPVGVKELVNMGFNLLKQFFVGIVSVS